MNGPRANAEHYSPMSYYSLGRVYPRERLREPFPRRTARYGIAFMRFVYGPYCVCAGEVFLPGQATDSDGAASIVGEVYVPGAEAGQLGCEC